MEPDFRGVLHAVWSGFPNRANLCSRLGANHPSAGCSTDMPLNLLAFITGRFFSLASARAAEPPPVEAPVGATAGGGCQRPPGSG